MRAHNSIRTNTYNYTNNSYKMINHPSMVSLSGIENWFIKNHSGTFHHENKTTALDDHLKLWMAAKGLSI